jgi:hypothetical protein
LISLTILDAGIKKADGAVRKEIPEEEMGTVLSPPAALILRSRGVLEDGFSSVFLRHTISRGWRYLPVKYFQ